jgi:hypothetical protein
MAALVEHFGAEHRKMFVSMDEFFDALLPRIHGKSNAEVNAIMMQVAHEQGIDQISDAEFWARADPERIAVQRAVDATPKH